MSDLGNADDRGTHYPEQEAAPLKQNAQEKTRATELTRNAQGDATQSDVLRWSKWMKVDFSETSFGGGELAETGEGAALATEVAEELSVHLAAATAYGTDENWHFTLDLGRFGEVDGLVSKEGGQLRVELYPRNPALSRYLAKHRRKVESMACAEISNDIVVKIG